MFIQSQLLQNGRNSVPQAAYSAALKQGAQQLPRAVAPAPRVFCTSGFLPQLHHRPHAHHTGYNGCDILTKGCCSHPTEEALKHPKRNLVTLNVSWIAASGMSLLEFSVLTALETESKIKIYEILAKAISKRFVLFIPVEGLGWGSWQHLSPKCIFFQRKGEYACMENHVEPMHLRYNQTFH